MRRIDYFHTGVPNPIDSKLNTLYGVFMGEGGNRMERKIKRIKCPECLNSMTVTVDAHGEAKGVCKKCKSVIIAKQSSERERLIRIVKA